MKKIVLRIDGMTCSACSLGLEKYLLKQKGIVKVNINLILALATIEYENISKKEVETYIRKAGFKSLGVFKEMETISTKRNDKILLIILGLLILFIMYISMGHMFKFPSIPFLNHKYPVLLSSFLFLITLIFLLYGFDILKNGIKYLIHKLPNMDTLVMFGVLFSFFYSIYGYIHILCGNPIYIKHLYFESVCMIIYFIKFGRYVENISKDKTKSAIQKLVQITPKYALLKESDNLKEVTIDKIKIDDILICKAGGKIAVDGEVVTGQTYVDEAFMTGESVPVLKRKGDYIIAGSINYNGYIEYKAKRIGKDSTVSQIVKLVVEATNSKNKIQRLADKISGYFVPIIFVIAFLNFIIYLMLDSSFENALIHMVTVLVVACPCALGLAVPLVIVVSNGLCAQNGLFLRNSEVLEKAQNIDTVVFDKTGTLTMGKLNVFKVYNNSNYNDAELLNIVANIENHSSHPIHTAFKVTKKLKIHNFKTINGKGVYGEIFDKKYYLGNEKILLSLELKNPYEVFSKKLTQEGCSIIYITENDNVIGLVGIKDIIRTDIKDVIEKFKDHHIDPVMLTGDNRVTANIIASELGIQKVVSNVSPEMKAKYIDDLIKKGKKVIMVGDGINDAPALARATIGISIHEGTDIAVDSSDVILMNNNIKNILDLISISKHSYHIIKQNLFWAFFYNICMVIISTGLFKFIVMTPMIGSIAMIFSSLTVVMNSLRLRRVKI